MNIWNWSGSGQLLTRFDDWEGAGGLLDDFQFGIGETTIITRNMEGLKVWNFSDRLKMCIIPTCVYSYHIDRLNNRIIALDYRRQYIRIYDAMTGQKLGETRKQTDQLFQGVFCPTSQVVLL